ncbi:PREDICTED: pentatricopeptide repeat-containing protein At4g21065-like [Nelumbo nucifera]|uniref:Pentatricopeptide repeat-containing protein At4g21065-like n=2 Tax=Nelumbo nucifera TaxID=4432 RepID=A0A1U8AUY9_NELNU|nr:PREDICTED: pentatricopeptide repeat-containing protein At4g21065-like [Nelumbo nucifera]XP_010267016.1 PREDICTED: pentatricopeptide repeat-containing protein At4g21065-like [Nelumbo nucifera]XP_010267017.1 PREDICTED: pentatricopeptide repeat-containing protein At4g21065-like [Nelumbo nucifera]XP_010267018.1 PREDICTED: pentatricopeptide repeat-containing protein At4g21065-like [Nelumbo nucifera]XP_010267019.1 PREDICTED: pentatricopeptide repeat-containing protein At4g21065-like [Nelumbo nucif
MRSPPPSFRGLSLSFPPVSNHSFRFLKGPPRIITPLFDSIRPCSVSCAVGIADTDPTSYVSCEGIGVRTLPTPTCSVLSLHLQLDEETQNGPRGLRAPTRHGKMTSKVPKIVETDLPIEQGRMLYRLGMGGVANSDCKATLKRYSKLLNACASSCSLNDGKVVHGQVVKNCLYPDSHLLNSLVNMYVKCGGLRCGRSVLERMPERDVVSWTTLISGFVAEGDGSEAIRLFSKMRQEGIWPNGFTFCSVLKACSILLALDSGRQVHGEVIKVGTFSDLFVGSALSDLYAKCGEMELAERVFFSMPEKNDVAWNVFLNGHAQMGGEKEVLKLFHRMTESEVRLSSFTLSNVLKACGNSGNAKDGQAVHSLAIKIGSEVVYCLNSSLVNMYFKCGLVNDAYKVFISIRDPDVVAWSEMIDHLNQQGFYSEAVELFAEMMQTGLRPNQYTLASLISAAINIGNTRYGDSIHACVWKLGYVSDNPIGNALITMYMRNGYIQDGFKVFKVMKNRDPISWNAVLSGIQDGEFCNQGPRIFKQMFMEGFKPNMCTFVSILRYCSNLSNVDFGQQVHTHITKTSLGDDSVVGTALVHMYAKCQSLENACLVFHRMKKRDLLSWTTIISGYAQTDEGEKAIKFFCQMQREGVCPNEFTLASCLKGCSSIAALVNGQQLHSWAIRAGHLDDMFVSSALIDMYGKCGSIEDAEALFGDLVSRDIVSWNTIICGYAQHGYGEKALKAFHCMLDEGFSPDKVTFIGVLSACSHVGLIEEGKQYFDSLNGVYRITPTIEHHACMVDILGRAGNFDKIQNFIQEMALSHDILIWQTVLGACRMHGNVKFAERAAEKLFELEPKEDSTYILLSNIYAAKGRWDDVAKVRALMSSQGVKKQPGCSWVEVDGQVHVFLSKDGSHLKFKEICLKLEELYQELTLAGYIPNTENVLQNVPETEKKENLLYHSERLALAFALVTKRPGEPIRIFKSIRICGDCHNFIKLISGITNRGVVIRDSSRFHHFQNGSCSCQDYW